MGMGRCPSLGEPVPRSTHPDLTHTHTHTLTTNHRRAMNIPYELNLDPMTTLILFLSILLGNTVVADGKSQWLIGVLMIFAYLLIGATYYLGEFE